MWSYRLDYVDIGIKFVLMAASIRFLLKLLRGYQVERSLADLYLQARAVDNEPVLPSFSVVWI